jgi:catechol 2,3-dioxygenase-like lactoylglutathione lyase family enzyme
MQEGWMTGAPADQPRLHALGLQTHLLADIRAFYHETLGFPLAAETPDALAFQAGGTRLEFARVTDGSQPYYHVAFNIPENKLELAKAWLAARVALLRHAETGEDVISFPAWDAHALFFYDPVGSLLELIARHTLPNAADGPFSTDDILYASEIALRAPEQAAAIAAIRAAFGLEHYLGGESFLGDERGLIIVSPKGRLWIPEYRKAGATFPTRIDLAGHGLARLTFPDAPFELVGVG